MALAITVSPKTSPQAPRPWLLVMMIEPRSVTARDQLEEQVGALAVDRQIANLVDD